MLCAVQMHEEDICKACYEASSNSRPGSLPHALVDLPVPQNALQPLMTLGCCQVRVWHPRERLLVSERQVEVVDGHARRAHAFVLKQRLQLLHQRRLSAALDMRRNASSYFLKLKCTVLQLAHKEHVIIRSDASLTWGACMPMNSGRLGFSLEAIAPLCCSSCPRHQKNTGR